MKKLLALVLSIGLMLGSYVNVAAQSPQIEKTNVAQNTRESNPMSLS